MHLAKGDRVNLAYTASEALTQCEVTSNCVTISNVGIQEGDAVFTATADQPKLSGVIWLKVWRSTGGYETKTIPVEIGPVFI